MLSSLFSSFHLSRLCRVALILLATHYSLLATPAFIKDLPNFKYGENVALEASAYDYITKNVGNSTALTQLAADTRASLANSQNPDATAVALWILGLVGTDADIPFISAQLGTSTNFYNAATALQQIATPAAIDALSTALGNSTNDTLSITLINALGWSRSPNAVPTLAKAGNSTNPVISAAARQALADNSTPAAAQALAGISTDLAAIPQLQIARTLCRQGDTTTAAPLVKKLIETKTLPAQIRLEAIRISLDYKLPSAPSLIKQLSAKIDPETRDFLLPYFAQLPAETRTQILNQLQSDINGTSTAQTLAIIINQLNAAEAAPFINSTNETTRLAAQRQISLTAGTSTIQTLLNNYLNAPESDFKNLQTLLAALPETANASIAQTLGTSTDESAKIKLLQLIKLRANPAFAQPILAIIGNSTGKLRSAAFDALSTTGDTGTSTLATLFLNAQTPVERAQTLAATKTAYRKSQTPDTDIVPILAAINQTQGAPRESLITLAAETGNPSALKTLLSLYAKSDDASKAALLRALAKWPDAAPADRLTQIAQNETDQKLRILAIIATTNQLARDTALAPADRLAKTEKLAPLSTRNDDRLALLSIAATIPLKDARTFINTFDQYPDLKAETLAAKKAHNATLKSAPTPKDPDE